MGMQRLMKDKMMIKSTGMKAEHPSSQKVLNFATESNVGLMLLIKMVKSQDSCILDGKDMTHLPNLTTINGIDELIKSFPQLYFLHGLCVDPIGAVEFDVV